MGKHETKHIVGSIVVQHRLNLRVPGKTVFVYVESTLWMYMCARVCVCVFFFLQVGVKIFHRHWSADVVGLPVVSDSYRLKNTSPLPAVFPPGTTVKYYFGGRSSLQLRHLISPFLLDVPQLLVYRLNSCTDRVPRFL